MKAAAPVLWPDGKRFAFTVFDDPDGQTLEDSRIVYSFLADLGFRTTMGVWTVESPGDQGKCQTCVNPAYLAHVLDMQRRGFEIGFHGAGIRTSDRAVTLQALETFKQHFGAYPAAMSNHFDNAESIYWGPARLGGLRRLIYKAATGRSRANRYFGEVPGHAYFWGDACQQHIRYCRNFVFNEMNTLRMNPEMPYSDPLRPFVREWYSASEGADAGKFLLTTAEENQDRLEEEGGACIMYTHFGKGFTENGKISPRFRELMTRLYRKNGWFVPVTPLLDYLRTQRGGHLLSPRERSQLEWRWLLQKLMKGSS